MSNKMPSGSGNVPKPTREAFVEYWKDFGRFTWGTFLFYTLYPAGLAVYGVVILRTPLAEWPWVVGAGAYVYLVAVPYVIVRRARRRGRGFARCENCGEWFGQDESGAYFGPNQKFRRVIETGRCGKCGEAVFADEMRGDNPGLPAVG